MKGGARKPKLIVIVFSLGCVVVVVEVVALGKLPAFSNNDYGYSQNLQVILFEIDCATFYANLLELFVSS